MPTDQWPFEERAKEDPRVHAMFNPAWSRRFLRLAREISTWSKDPSTQVGAVIVDRDKRIISMGFNGLPKGVEDTPERLENRDIKYKVIIHGERNALLFARQPVVGAALFTWPFQPCASCAAMVIQAGITHVVAPVCPPDKLERWRDEYNLATQMFKEAGVNLDLVVWVPQEVAGVDECCHFPD